MESDQILFLQGNTLLCFCEVVLLNYLFGNVYCLAGIRQLGVCVWGGGGGGGALETIYNIHSFLF